MSKFIAKIKSFMSANEREMDYLMELYENDNSIISPSLSMLAFSWKMKNQSRISSLRKCTQIDGHSDLSRRSDRRLRFRKALDIKALDRPVEQFLQEALN